MGVATPRMDIEEVGREMRKLECDLSRAELHDRAERMATRHAEIGRLKARKKAMAADIKAKIDALECEMEDLGNAVTTGKEEREVECKIEHNFTEKRRTVTRTDTWDEIEERALTADEIHAQMGLPLGGGAPADPLAAESDTEGDQPEDDQLGEDPDEVVDSEEAEG